MFYVVSGKSMHWDYPEEGDNRCGATGYTEGFTFICDDASDVTEIGAHEDWCVRSVKSYPTLALAWAEADRTGCWADAWNERSCRSNIEDPPWEDRYEYLEYLEEKTAP